MSSSDFNPRSPHGERRHKPGAPLRDSSISIHAPRTGSDRTTALRSGMCRISIHAPRTGSDGPPGRTTALRSDFNPRSPHGERRPPSGRAPVLIYFNPRSPHGERQNCKRISVTLGIFQSTLPARGATASPWTSPGGATISIHAPRTGSDVNIFQVFEPGEEISIHAPRTGSDAGSGGAAGAETISIHAPRTGSDHRKEACADAWRISIHAPRTGSDKSTHRNRASAAGFQSTLPARGATTTHTARMRP